MWSVAADAGYQSSSTTAVVHCGRSPSGDESSSVVSTVTTCGAPVHLVVIEPPPNTVNSESSNCHEYPWGLTYRRLRRASAMIGASAVAIDNKIEQAMDLVKSHLLFAVREEVDMLKEQIKDLTARNCHLELENSILRASASPDTLAQLAAARPHAPPT